MEKGRKIQYLVSLAVSLAAVTAGVSLTWSTSVIPKFHNNETGINLTEEEISWIAALASIGYMNGSLLTRYISDRFGRRATILGSALPIITGTIIILNGTTAWMIYVARLVWGTGTGMIGTVSAMYLAEISDKEIRGIVLAANRFMLSFGSFLVMSVGPFVSYHALSYLLLVLPICYFLACCFVPETPYYLLKEGKVDAARKALTTLSGNKDEKILEDRLSAMRSDVRTEMLRSSSAKELFTGKQYRKAMIIVTGLKLTQIMAGSIAIQQYLGRITQESKTNINVSTALIVFGAVKFVVGILSSVLVERIGRRPLMIYSYLFSGVTLAIVGTYFIIEPNSSTYYGFIPFFGIIIFTILSTVGYDTLGFVVLGEVFPINVKSVAMSYVQILGGFLNFLSVKGYQQMKDVAGLTGVFWFYASFALIGAVFTYFVVPETKGKSLREIQIELQGSMADEAGEKLNHVIVNEDGVITEVKGLVEKDSKIVGT